MRWLLLSVLMFSLNGDAFAWPRHGGVQPSGVNLISGASEFLKSGGGDQLVSQ